jgi:hypothetical protein
VISAKPFRAGAYRERTGFMHELRRDGIYIYEARGAASLVDWHAATQASAAEFLTFLAEGCEDNPTPNYSVGSPSVTSEGARLAIDTAGRLIDCIAALPA